MGLWQWLLRVPLVVSVSWLVGIILSLSPFSSSVCPPQGLPFFSLYPLTSLSHNLLLWMRNEETKVWRVWERGRRRSISLYPWETKTFHTDKWPLSEVIFLCSESMGFLTLSFTLTHAPCHETIGNWGKQRTIQPHTLLNLPLRACPKDETHFFPTIDGEYWRSSEV